MGNNKTLNDILISVKAEDEAALAEEALLKELESSAIDDSLLKEGNIDDIAMSQSWEKRRAAVEMRRQLIKERIRMSNSDDVQFIHAKKDVGVKAPGPKKVAVYARVSTKSLDQASSIENQTRYYTEKIEKTADWELYKIYSDEGKSGTSTKWRPEFNQMMQDAKEKKFDLILCASVSRFARNVSECLEYVSKLKTMNPSHPVSVYFESEGIDTLDPTTSQNLDIHALMADWESRIKSGRMILSYDQRIFTCQFPVADLLGYRHTKSGKLVMVPEEAKTVRVIFLAYFCGYSTKEIAEILTEKQRPTLKGRTDWNAGMVKSIMMNERRWGSLQARKYIVIDYKQKKVAKNNGDREAAFVSHHHAGIVSPEIAKAVQFINPVRGLESGVQNVEVICNGALKGFVGINPKWEGIDSKTFLSLCCSAYDEDELESIRKDSLILSGEEHRNILSFDFAGYQVPYGVYFMNNNTPSLTLSNNKISFNNACHTKLSTYKYVEVLYHPILQMVVVRGRMQETQTSLLWLDENNKKYMSFPSGGFVGAIYERMQWNRSFKFKFRGIYRKRGNEEILIFCLDEPRIYPGRAVKTDEIDCDDEVRFIKYKNNEVHDEDDYVPYAYPDEWEHYIGLSSLMRERRDRLSDSITENDIKVEGTCAINPLIGEIPSKEEALVELEDLLISM